MKTIVAAILLSALLAFMVWRATRLTEAEQRADRFLAERDSVTAIINEHKDSAVANTERADRRERVVTRLVEVTRVDSSLSDSLASTAASLEEWRAAWTVERRVSDTLRLALGVERNVSADLRAAASYWQLAYMADSAELLKAEIVIADLRHEKRRTFLSRVGVSVGYGAVVTGSVIRVGPSVAASVRVWP